MSTYSVVDNQTGEIMYETDSAHLQAAYKLLQTTKRLDLHELTQNHANRRDRQLAYSTPKRPPYGYVRRPQRKVQRQHETMRESITNAAVTLVTVVAVMLGLTLLTI